MRRVKAAKGSRRPEAHEPGKGPKEQNSTFPLEGTHATNQPAKARTVSADSNGNTALQIARHVTLTELALSRAKPTTGLPLATNWPGHYLGASPLAVSSALPNLR